MPERITYDFALGDNSARGPITTVGDLEGEYDTAQRGLCRLFVGDRLIK